ncbi:hypothetical protein [Actinomadura harenae]|uniref:Uncharacterized protein n=1 Tax=Actinomadura harenae TaxID=2483351 RepID=A0A3M2LLJ5_9ACTN|nr:hypothetical protein [Actinomadura harenae]RMI38304.1 hypothetical protein EBO15_33280 [Actinomadura harenae]
MDELYNLRILVDGIVPGLVGRKANGGARVSREFPLGEPVVEIVGGRASGKTTLIDVLYDGYKNAVPLGRVRLTEPAFRRVDSQNASAVSNLLYQLQYELEKPAGRRELPFPRLSVGLLVVTSWAAEGAAETEGGSKAPPRRGRELAKLKHLVGEVLSDSRKTSELQVEVLEVLAAAVGPALGALLPGLPDPVPILRVAIRQLQDRGANRKALAWWVEQLPEHTGNALDRLMAFAEDFHDGGENRVQAEGHLIAAFLADIDHGYGLYARFDQAYPPLILLDDVDDCRERFLLPLAAEFGRVRARRGALGKVVRPVVIATSHGDGGPVVQATTPNPWREMPRLPPAAWHVRLGLPRVTDRMIRKRLGQVPARDDVISVIGRVSGGRIGVAFELARFFAERDGLAVLDRDCLDRLAAFLVPDPRDRDALTDLSTALDPVVAPSLWSLLQEGEYPIRQAENLVRRLRRDVLDAGHWDQRPWPGERGMPLVQDPGLRIVLIERLRTPATGPDQVRVAHERWRRIHEHLRDRYLPSPLGPGAAGPGIRDVRDLHHSLALEERERVVANLHRLFAADEADSRSWLHALNIICAAPRPPDGFPAPPRGPRRCPACSDDGASADEHRRIGHLLDTVWRMSAPLAVRPRPRERDLEAVEYALQDLREAFEHRAPDRGNAFVHAKWEWPEALEQGVQAPDLPIRERDDARP